MTAHPPNDKLSESLRADLRQIINGFQSAVQVRCDTERDGPFVALVNVIVLRVGEDRRAVVKLGAWTLSERPPGHV